MVIGFDDSNYFDWVLWDERFFANLEKLVWLDFDYPIDGVFDDLASNSDEATPFLLRLRQINET